MDDLVEQGPKCQRANVCNLTHSRVVVWQGFSQLPSSQEFTAHLQVVLNLSLGGPQDPWNTTRKLGQWAQLWMFMCLYKFSVGEQLQLDCLVTEQ